MKCKKVKTIVTAAMVLSMVHGGVAQEQDDDKIDILLAGGAIVSPGYKKSVEDVYETRGYDTTTLGTWIDLGFGIEYKAMPQLSVIGSVDLWINAATVEGGMLDETYINTIIMPGIYAQYYFTEARTWYVNGGLSIPIANTGSDFLELDGKGVGLAGSIGYAFSGQTLRVEGGYSYMPVDVSLNGSKVDDYNFGGFQLRFILGL